MTHGKSSGSRIDLLDWLKGCAIIAVVLDHLWIVPEPYVVWSVNLFVLVTAFIFSQPRYVFSFIKLALKIFQLLYLTTFAVLLVRGLNPLFNIPNPQPLLSVFLNPYALFVHNKYLGDIWYIALHFQFLILFYFFLKNRVAPKPPFVFGIAVVVNLASILFTHFVLKRFHTILVSSWLVFLAAGFYGMRPFLRTILDFPHNRLLGAGAGLGLLLSLYGLSPFFPWLFTNTYRAFFINLPFYFALILFLAESFHLLGDFGPGRVLKSAVHLLGRHSLAIYLTHGPFQLMWRMAFPSSLAVAVLCVLSGVIFGIVADWLFLQIKKSGSRIGPSIRELSRYNPHLTDR